MTLYGNRNTEFSSLVTLHCATKLSVNILSLPLDDLTAMDHSSCYVACGNST